RLVNEGVVSLERFIELSSTNPARILKLHNRGTLRAGSYADVTIIHPERTWTFDASRAKSKSRNTPFDGYTFQGGAVATIVGGRIVFLHPDFEHLSAPQSKAFAQRGKL